MATNLVNTSASIRAHILNITIAFKFVNSRISETCTKKTHWLPIAYRIQFKIAMIVHRCVYGTSPNNLQSMHTPFVPKIHLRSSNSTAVNFVVP